MPNASTWDIITNPSASHVILGIDFPAAGRAEASYAELMTKIGSGWSEYSVAQTVPPGFRLDQRPTGDSYIQHWMQGVQQGQWQVTAVLGYCVGSVYAAAIAEDVSRLQHTAPKLILFDPQLSSIGSLTLEMYKIISTLEPLISKDDAEHAKARMRELTEAGADDIRSKRHLEAFDRYYVS
jgi:hypothetical protein